MKIGVFDSGRGGTTVLETVKKMVPDPFSPERQGSSHMCSPTRAMRSCEVMPQKPDVL
jgi:hypothetical protein